MIEAFAFLTGRIQHKLDDEFPELTDALLNILYPHYLAPIPSCMTVEFEADPARTPLNNGYEISTKTTVLTTPINDLRCRYRTVYPVRLPSKLIARSKRGSRVIHDWPPRSGNKPLI